MPSFSRLETVLVQYPFSDLSAAKVRPAVVVHAPHVSQDCLIVPLTSRTSGLLPGEFVLAEWAAAGLHVPTALKRGLYTIHERLIAKRLGQLKLVDAQQLDYSLCEWLGLL